MDYNKIIPLTSIQPVVNIANYFTLKDVSSWGPRILPDYELILIREGLFGYERKGEDLLPLNPGDILCIPPGEEHTFSAMKKTGSISCIHCLPTPDAPWQTGLVRLDPAPLRKTVFGQDYSEMEVLFKKCSVLFTGYDNYREELLSTVCREIWLRCGSKWSSRNHPRTTRMDEMILYIHDHCREDLTRHDLAEVFHLSPEYINALFKKEMGLSPTDCINRERIFLAYEYLNTKGLTVKETAYSCGFNDPFYFSRVFKNILGITPEMVRSRRFFNTGT